MSAPAALTLTGPGWIDFKQLLTLDTFNHVTDTITARLVDFDAFAIKSFNRPSAHAGTNNTVDMISDQLIHRMTSAVRMISVAVLKNPDIAARAVIEREKGRRAKVLIHFVVDTGVPLGRYTY